MEQNVFTMSDENDIKNLYGGNENELKRYIRSIVRKLFTFCITAGEIPYIRHGKSQIATAIATALSDRLEKSRKRFSVS